MFMTLAGRREKVMRMGCSICMLLVALFTNSCSAISRAPSLGACEPLGTLIKEDGLKPVACKYDYETAKGRIDTLCPSSSYIQLLSFGFGQGPEVVRKNGCLVCLIAERADIFAQIEPGKPAPEHLHPSISCLGIFLPEPAPL